jgi:hypothetical protein
MYKKIILLILITLFPYLSCYDGLLDTYDNSITYNLRDRGPAGGWIFYINPNYKTDGWRYLEAAPEDCSVTRQWLSTPTWLNVSLAQGGTLTTIGSGKNNTEKIIQYKVVGGRTAHAAEYCDELVVNGYSDWFLPSKDELQAIWWNLISDHSSANSGRGQPYSGSVGGFTTNNYWSSSEFNATISNIQNFNNGSQTGGTKDITTWAVRAVRAF